MASPVDIPWTRYIPHAPEPPQHAFLWLSCLEALYGGAAGGGKSDALLMAALQYVDQPGYAAMIFRRTFPDLNQPGAIMSRSKEWLSSTDAAWNAQDHRWTFPSGATLTFAHMEREDDRYQYQGAELDFVAFDELTQFTELQYTYMASRIRRREGSPIPGRLRAATNPGGRGHEWVRRRFIDKEPHPDDPADTTAARRARIFIPARLADNPHVDQDAYRANMMILDPQTRQQLLEGDWDAREPGAWVYDAQQIDAAAALGQQFDQALAAGKMPPPTSGELALGIDWGDVTTAGYVLWPLERGGVYVPPSEVVEAREEPGEITRRLLEQAAKYDHRLGEARFDAAGAQSNRTFVREAERILGPLNPVRKQGRPNTRPVPFGDRKRETMGFLRLLLKRAGEGHSTRIVAISPANRELLRQLRALQDDGEDRVIKKDDHSHDALIAGLSPIAQRYRADLEATG